MSRWPRASDDDQRSGLANAAGRAAFFPARAAARAWRGPIEEAVDEVLSAPELARVLDRALAGSLPEEVARSLVRHRVLERIGAELAQSGEIERLVVAALASPQTGELTDRVLASDEMQRALNHVASSPELRDAIQRQTTGLAEDVVGGVRASAVRIRRQGRGALAPSGAAPHARSRPGSRRAGSPLRPTPPLTLVISMAVVGMASLVASLVGTSPAGVARGTPPRRPPGLLVMGTYFVLFWSSAGQTPGMRLLRVRVRELDGSPLSIGRSLVRLVGLLLSIVPLGAGFIPVLFTERRRGLADFLAGTVVVYDDARRVP